MDYQKLYSEILALRTLIEVSRGNTKIRGKVRQDKADILDKQCTNIIQLLRAAEGFIKERDLWADYEMYFDKQMKGLQLFIDNQDR